MLFIASFSTYNTIYNIKRRVVSGGYLFGFVRTVYTTPRVIITTTTVTMMTAQMMEQMTVLMMILETILGTKQTMVVTTTAQETQV